MATICKKCGGLIPDVVFGHQNRNDCKNHIKKKSTFKRPDRYLL